MATISAAERKRLAAILGMLGSDHAGERDNASRQAEAFRKKHGLTWAELLSLSPIEAERPAPQPPPRPAYQPPPRASAYDDLEASLKEDAEAAEARSAEAASAATWGVSSAALRSSTLKKPGRGWVILAICVCLLLFVPALIGAIEAGWHYPTAAEKPALLASCLDGIGYLHGRMLESGKYVCHYQYGP